MKQLATIAVFVLGLVSCSSQRIDPAGVYLLNSGGKFFTLTIRSDGNYSLKIDIQNKPNGEIHGEWQDEDGTGRSISFSGIIWTGTEPHAGNGYWKAIIEGSSQNICLDGEGLTCFSKRGRLD